MVIFYVCIVWQVPGWEGSSYTFRTTDVVATSLTLAVGGAVALAVEALLGVRTPGGTGRRMNMDKQNTDGQKMKIATNN